MHKLSLLAVFALLLPGLSSTARGQDEPPKKKTRLTCDQARRSLKAYQRAHKRFTSGIVQQPVNSPRTRIQKRQIMRLIRNQRRLKREFSAPALSSAPFRRCAMYRIAEGTQRIAQKVRHAPLPKELVALRKPEAVDAYRDQIERAFVMPLINQASRIYAQLHKSQATAPNNPCIKWAHIAHQATRSQKKPATWKPIPPGKELPLLKKHVAGLCKNP